jgi:hypothetical protein
MWACRCLKRQPRNFYTTVYYCQTEHTDELLTTTKTHSQFSSLFYLPYSLLSSISDHGNSSASELSSRFVLFVVSESESESYVTTDGQSASLSWNEAPIWAFRPDFHYCETVAGLLMWGALSDKRTVRRLQLLLALASAVILGSESRGAHDHISLSQIRDFHFRRLLRLEGSRWRHSTPPPHGNGCISGWSTLCSLGADRIEITVFYSSVIVSYQSVSMETSLLSRCVAADGS